MSNSPHPCSRQWKETRQNSRPLAATEPCLQHSPVQSKSVSSPVALVCDRARSSRHAETEFQILTGIGSLILPFRSLPR
jgi:hypothetical protein